MLRNHLLPHRKSSTRYSNLNNTLTVMKNVYIGVICYSKTNIVSKYGLQLESLSTSQTKAKKMIKKNKVEEKMAFLLVSKHQKFKLFLAWEGYPLLPLLNSCCRLYFFSSTAGSFSVPQLAALTTFLQLMAFGTVPNLTLLIASL